MQRRYGLWIVLNWLCGSAVVFAVGPNPAHDWRSFNTPHFVVHFEASQRAQAQSAAAIAEAVLPKITGVLKWQPVAKTEIILMDDYDVANGFATPLPFSHTGIFLTPPDDGELLENTDWLELVLTHELTHIVHLDKARGPPGFLQHIFGRHPLLFPNLWQPSWLIEGLATYVESDPAQHRGRLDNAMFDAYMALEVQQGVKSLREINSDGRAFPVNKAYLYGAYFYRFLEQTYGAQAVYQTVEDYSDNLLPFRVHSNPERVTGKTMDVLWLEYQAWLRARFANALAVTDKTGAGATRVLATHWNLDSPVLLADGSFYVVVDDGLQQAYVLRKQPNGSEQKLLEVEAGARIDVNARGELLIAQPEICANYHYYYDLYVWSETSGKQRLTSCARHRSAMWQGNTGIVALHNNSGRAELAQLHRDGRFQQSLYVAQVGEEIPSFAVNASGERLSWISKRDGQWRLQERVLTDALPATVTTLWLANTPLLSPRYSADDQSILLVAEHEGRLNAWRVSRDGSAAERLTDVTGAVVALTASNPEHKFISLQLVNGGFELRQQSADVALAALAPAPEISTNRQALVLPAFSNDRHYSALETIAPRAWFPTAFVGDGALAFGAELFGQDALAWHQYLISPQYETSQGEWLGSLVYSYDQRHFLSAFREMEVTSSIENGDNEEEIASYKIRTSSQWLSFLPWLRLQQRFYTGIGVGSARETYHLVDGPSIELQDERVAALFFSYDSRRSSWWSEGSNRGQLLSLLGESYAPFDGRYEGEVWRADWRGNFAVAGTTLALRFTEARGGDNTESFELGGSYNSENLGVPRLNERDWALRGYRNGEPELVGKNARVGGIEWRTPLAELDAHFMVPPIGLNRLSAAFFYEAGATWTDSGGPERYYRSAGLELLAELKLGYRLGLLVRAGFARGLDEPGDDEVYFRLGRSF